MSDEHYVSSLLAAKGEGHNTDCVGMGIHSNHSTGGLPLHCCAALQLLLTIPIGHMGCLYTAAPCCSCRSLRSWTPLQESLIHRHTTPARSPQQPCRVSATMAGTSNRIVQTSCSSGHLTPDVVHMHQHQAS